MTDHHAIQDAVAFIEKHGYALLFFWVFAEQSAVPMPSAPLLLAAGVLFRTGRLHVLPAVACCVSAALLADTIWFQLGKHGGRRILRLLCRVSLEPDSCVRRTENSLVKYGLKSLLIAKFVPGLNAVSAPLAGSFRIPYWRFLLYDGAGASIWSMSYFAVGYLFGDELESVLAYASRMGSALLVLFAALFASWIAWKFIQRRRFLRQLDVARITPEELRERLDAGENVFIVDLRHQPAESPEVIPGAARILPEELSARHLEIPRDQEIVLVCS